MSYFILIQVVSPPAIAILIRIRNYGGNARKSGSILLIPDIACLVVIPVWRLIGSLI